MNWIKQQVANVAGTQEPIYGPSAIQPVGQHADAVPWTKLEKDDMKWAALSYTNVETQSFYLMAKTGHIALVQVIYSNVASLHTTCQFNSKVFYPKATGKQPLWCSDSLTNADFDEDKLSFHADGCAFTLNEKGDQYALKSVVNDQSVVNVTVTQTAPGFVVGKDGTTKFGTDLENPWGSMRHAFWPRCKVNGSIITKDEEISFDGQALFCHALQGMKPHHAAARWNFVDLQTPTYSAIMMEYTTPPSYGSTVVNVGGIATDNEVICAGSKNTATHTKAKHDSDNDWPEPEEVHFKWTGTTKDDKPVEAVLEGHLGGRLDRVDVLANVPGFIKTIVGGTVGTKPYIYQYAPEKKLSLKVTVDGKETIEEGVLFSEATFIS